MRPRGAGSALALLFLAGCTQPAQPAPPRPHTGVVVAQTDTTDGLMVTLRVDGPGRAPTKDAAPAVGSVCVSVTESYRDGGEIGTVTSCGSTDRPASGWFVMNATVLTTTCESSTVYVGPDAEHVDTAVPALHGVLLVPFGLTPIRPESVAVACVDRDGTVAAPSVVPVPR